MAIATIMAGSTETAHDGAIMTGMDVASVAGAANTSGVNTNGGNMNGENMNGRSAVITTVTNIRRTRTTTTTTAITALTKRQICATQLLDVQR